MRRRLGLKNIIGLVIFYNLSELLEICYISFLVANGSVIWYGLFQDENRYNAGRGAHLTLKRAEKARAAVNKLPGK